MSRIFSRGRHTVLVQNRKTERDEGGGRVMVNVGERIAVPCLYEPVREWSSEEENRTHGLQMIHLVVIRAVTWPGDVHSHVIIDGNLYETVGAPQHFNMSRRTEHWRITVRYVGADPA